MTSNSFEATPVMLKKQNIYITSNNKLHMNKWAEILVGLILVVVAILISFYYPSWFASALNLLKGGILLIILGIGLLFVMLGISELKE